MGRWITPASDGAGAFTCYTLRLPDDPGFASVVFGALADMARPYFWEELGTGLTADETAALFQEIFDYARESRGCLIGTIFAHALAVAPVGSLACDGATYLRADYPALYDALDAAFIVDPTHFRVPDARGRNLIGTGQGAGLTNRTIDGAGGEETHTLVTAEMPSHQHLEIAAQGGPALAGEIPTAYLTFNIQQLTTATGGNGAAGTFAAANGYATMQEVPGTATQSNLGQQLIVAG